MTNEQSPTPNRRNVLKATAGAAVGAIAAAQIASAQKNDEAAELKGNINHSIVKWCYESHFTLDEMAKVAVGLGAKSIEITTPEEWAALKKHELTCALAPSHLFVQGMNNPRYQPMCLEMIRKSIDDSADAGVKTVITFTGYGEETGDWADGGIPELDKLPDDRRRIEPDEGIKNCVEGYKQIVGYAEKKGVNLSLEMLNTRADDHPMKGHPGYQGDHTDYCMEIIKQVGSPRLGLLFDVYHVQIMDGDIIRRIKQCGEAINHVHTAGNPGRGELDRKQEINYPPIMQALVDIGYKGFVGHEFIPTRDPLKGLQQAVRVCDV